MTSLLKKEVSRRRRLYAKRKIVCLPVQEELKQTACFFYTPIYCTLLNIVIRQTIRFEKRKKDYIDYLFALTQHTYNRRRGRRKKNRKKKYKRR